MKEIDPAVAKAMNEHGICDICEQPLLGHSLEGLRQCKSTQELIRKRQQQAIAEQLERRFLITELRRREA